MVRGGYQGRVILAPRHVTPVVDKLLGHSTKATTGDEASSTAIKARLVASTARALEAAELLPSVSRQALVCVSIFFSYSRDAHASACVRDYIEEIVFVGIAPRGKTAR